MSLLAPCPGCGRNRKADEGHHLCRECEGYTPKDRTMARDETCLLCMGDACEFGCRRCHSANVGPDSHRVCRLCGGAGVVKGGQNDG